MEKKTKFLGIILLLLLCVPFISAESIAFYKVPASVPLNQPITATGVFVPDGNVYANKLCSFYFFDSQNNLLMQSTDQYTNATGRFAMPGVQITEPLFQRGQTYILHTECRTASADANFLVEQRQEVFSISGFAIYPQAFILDLLYFKDPQVSVTLFFMALFAVIIIVVSFFMINKFVLNKN
jgi:hypothetical protein